MAFGYFSPTGKYRPRQGVGWELDDNIHGRYCLSILFSEIKETYCYKTAILPPKKIIIQFPSQTAVPRGHRDALGFILSSAPQRPFEVLDKPKTSATNSKL